MSLEAIKELINKQKIVESMVHSQNMPRRDVVETLVHRQHLAELGALIARLSAAEIGGILEALPIADANLFWERVPEGRRNDVLWEVSDTIREYLTGTQEPGFAVDQLNAFYLADGRLKQASVRSRKDLEDIQPIWVDLLGASQGARQYIGTYFGLELPDPDDATDLEISSRFRFEENDEIHLYSNFLLGKEAYSRSVPVAFAIRGGVLFTVRNDDLPVFRLQRNRARGKGVVNDCYDLLIGLYGADVEYSADALEGIYSTLSNVGKKALGETISDQDAAKILANIAEVEDLNGSIRSNILDNQRALAFLMQAKVLSHMQSSDAKLILRNIESLNSHTAFLFDKINFFMDATIGFININQNRRINQLTVFGVVFMPLNILAGIGGMSEFSMMTRGIPWQVSYVAFVIAMGCVGCGTYIALKHFEAKRLKNACREENPTSR